VIKSTLPIKSADKPHYYTIALSIGALIVSIISASISSLSWYESHASRQLATMATQAFLYASDITVTPIDDPARKAAVKAGVLNVRFEVKLVNTGKVNASDIKVKYNYSLSPLGSSHPWVACFKQEGDTFQTSLFGLGPGSSGVIAVFISEHKDALSCVGDGKATLNLYGTLSYLDSATNAIQTRHWCFDGVVTLRELAASSVTLNPCPWYPKSGTDDRR
jgi:hypothetical protein